MPVICVYQILILTHVNHHDTAHAVILVILSAYLVNIIDLHNVYCLDLSRLSVSLVATRLSLCCRLTVQGRRKQN